MTKKRVFDFICSIIGLIVFFPMFILISILISLDSKGPVLFKQKRVGKNGGLFTLIKFRSMVINHQDNNTISVKGDPRITKIGIFLRKYKLDELPELWNVVKGDMSLVGPRPDISGYADKLVGQDRNILKLRPGITGEATLKYANEEEILAKQENPKKYNDEIIFPDKIKINLEYYNHQSLWLDIKIIFATIFRRIY